MYRVAAAALLLAAAPSAAATASADISPALLYGYETADLSGSATYVFLGASGSGVAGSLSVSGYGYAIDGSGQGDFGRVTSGIGVSAPAIADDPSAAQRTSFDYGQGLSRIGVNDYISVTTAAAGPLTATAHWAVTGAISRVASDGGAFGAGLVRAFGVTSDGNVFFLFSRDGQAGPSGTGVVQPDGSLANQAFAGDFSFAMPFTGSGAFNPFFFDVQCMASASIGPAGSGGASCDGLGFRWLGISEVRDGGGNILTDWTIQSSSGFDYANAFTAPVAGPSTPVTVTYFPLAGAVPEPESWALLIAGFGLTGAAQRLSIRRRRQARGLA